MNAGFFTFGLAAALSLTQSPSTPVSTGVPECDRYVTEVRACLPRMCEEERILRELELDLAVETIAAVVKTKGAAVAAEQCARDVTAERREDLYGCHADSPGAATRVELTPAGNALVLRFSSAALAEAADVSVAEPLAEDAAVFRVTKAQGAFVLDTRTAAPLPSSKGPSQFEADTPYCYTIATPADDPLRRRVLRKGVLVTKAP